MNQVKLGIIGLGNMGSGHCNNILAGLTPEIKLTAAADLRQSRRDWAKETLPDDVVLFENGDQLIESGLCDAVIIATPHYEHPRLAILAFEHGLHVMSEKPAGVYTKQVREMNEAAIRSGKVFGMMFNQRTNCVYRKMHEMVQSGKYGQIKRVNWIITDWYRTQAYYNSGGWRATWDGEGGGVLLNQCPHNLDLLQWNKILLSPSRLIPLRSAQNPHNCWVFETIYHSSCVLFDRPLHSKSCIKIVVVCRHIFLRKSVSAPKCQKLDKFSMKRTGTL